MASETPEGRVEGHTEDAFLGQNPPCPGNEKGIVLRRRILEKEEEKEKEKQKWMVPGQNASKRKKERQLSFFAHLGDDLSTSNLGPSTALLSLFLFFSFFSAALRYFLLLFCSFWRKRGVYLTIGTKTLNMSQCEAPSGADLGCSSKYSIEKKFWKRKDTRRKKAGKQKIKKEIAMLRFSRLYSPSLLFSVLSVLILVEDWSVEQVSAKTAIDRGLVGFEPKWQCHSESKSCYQIITRSFRN